MFAGLVATPLDVLYFSFKSKYELLDQNLSNNILKLMISISWKSIGTM